MQLPPGRQSLQASVACSCAAPRRDHTACHLESAFSSPPRMEVTQGDVRCGTAVSGIAERRGFVENASDAHSSAWGGHLGGARCLAMREKAMPRVPAYMFLCVFGGHAHSILLGREPGIQLQGLCGISRNCQTVFQQVNQPAAQQSTEDSVSGLWASSGLSPSAALVEGRAVPAWLAFSLPRRLVARRGCCVL